MMPASMRVKLTAASSFVDAAVPYICKAYGKHICFLFRFISTVFHLLADGAQLHRRALFFLFVYSTLVWRKYI